MLPKVTQDSAPAIDDFEFNQEHGKLDTEANCQFENIFSYLRSETAQHKSTLPRLLQCHVPTVKVRAGLTDHDEAVRFVNVCKTFGRATRDTTQNSCEGIRAGRRNMIQGT